MAGIDRLRKVRERQKRVAQARESVGNPAATAPFVIEGEPLIYSIKYPLGTRHHPPQYWANKANFSKLRCWFRRFRESWPLVLIVTFYVSPFRDSVKLTKKELKEEKTPALRAWEVCDYLLSLLEMLRLPILQNYTQVVKIEANKVYSGAPRTVFQLMRYEDWEYFYSKHPFYTKAKSFGAPSKTGLLQS